MRVLETPLGERAIHGDGIISLFHRVRSEFLEMPGLRLTPAQAARLWALDRSTSERILDGLTAAGFLLRNREGAYVRASMA
jgi:DNA-binding IclR family transcriptional regulator